MSNAHIVTEMHDKLTGCRPCYYYYYYYYYYKWIWL